MTVQSKGAHFEREICVKLSLWVSGGLHKDIFWRTAMSGGRATVFKKKGLMFRQSGDVTAVALDGHDLTDNYYIECKHYKDLDFPGFLLKKTGTLTNFLKKTRDEATHYKTKPLLIVKQNRYPTYLIARKRDLRLHWLTHTTDWAVYLRHLDCHVYKLNDILKSNYKLVRSRL